jgi:hypothetical protein
MIATSDEKRISIMTSTLTNDDDEPDRDADAMKDQLRKDVASWSAARSGSAGETPDLAGRSAKQPPAARATRQKAKPAQVTVSAPVEKKPFRMSYDGTTDRDYIAQRIKLGAR